MSRVCRAREGARFGVWFRYVALSQYKRAADEQREREERQGKKKDIKGYGWNGRGSRREEGGEGGDEESGGEGRRVERRALTGCEGRSGL